MEGNANSADTQRMFFTVVGNAVAAHRLEIGKQRVEPGQCLWRARLVSATDQCFNGGIGELRQIGFVLAVRSRAKVSPTADTARKRCEPITWSMNTR